VTILGQPRFQLLYALQERRHLLTQCGVLGFQSGDVRFWCHASMLHVLRKSASYHGGR